MFAFVKEVYLLLLREAVKREALTAQVLSVIADLGVDLCHLCLLLFA